MIPILANIVVVNWTVAVAALASAIGVGMIGAKAVESVGRNPGAFTPILVMGILGMALAEAIVFYAIFLTKYDF